jgi:SAM-dependent methyltransferase
MNDLVSTMTQRQGDVSRFTDIDLTPDARFFVEFMDAANTQPDVCRLKPALADQLRLRPDARVLDVGCGTGDDARVLASLVGGNGKVVGIDASETMIGVARERSRATSVPVEFAVGDALALDFPDGAFDACRCERVLMHLEGAPARALAEMVRVTQPGGRIAVSDFHWDGLVIDHPDRTFTRVVVQTVSDGIRHSSIGSQLPRLMADAGLDDVHVEGHALRLPHSIVRHMFHGPLTQAQESGRLAEAEIAEWWRPLDEAESRGRFMAAMPAFIVSGTVHV